MLVQTDKNFQAFEGLVDEWRALHDACPDTSVFQSWEWQSSWWRHYGRNQPLRLMTVRQGGSLVGIAALYIQRVAGARVLRFVGTGGDTSPDDLGPILASPTREAVAAVMSSSVIALRGSDWDVLLLSDLDEGSLFWRQLQASLAQSRCTFRTGLSADIVFVDLPATWGDYLQGVSGHRRHAIRHVRRKSEAASGASFEMVAGSEQLDSAYNQLVELHRRRFTAVDVAHAFSTRSYVEFHRDVVRLCAARGWIRFYLLKRDSAAVAALYCYRFRNRIYHFQSGFDPGLQKLRPGSVLMGYAIEHAISEGNEVFDYLRGEHEYKREWGKGERRTATLTAYAGTLATLAYRLKFEGAPALKERLKRQAPWLIPLVRRTRRHAGRDHA